MKRHSWLSLLALVALLLVQPAEAAKRKRKAIQFPNAGTQLESFENTSPDANRDTASEADPIGSDQILSSGDNEEDLDHYHAVTRRMGIDLGMMIPFGDYAKEFTYSPMIGFHATWEAIAPVHVLVEMRRSSSPQKSNPTNAKLSLNTISIGTQAAFGVKRFAPFARLAGSLNFNDVSFNDGRRVTAGTDFNLTTVGLNLGLGVDFVVGREVSVGLDITYYYSVPKKLTLTDGTNTSTFDLGSPYAIVGLRVNF